MDIAYFIAQDPEYPTYPISILEIIFLHYVARSFCETIKLPKEMPKIAKCILGILGIFPVYPG
jgi:hypothetical protein